MTTFAHSLTTPRARNGQQIARCVAQVQETHDVRTFWFSTEAFEAAAFKPGQFITLTLDIDGERVMRSYTLSSSPARTGSVSLTIKRVPGGKVSNWLHDHLRVGDQVEMQGPMGQFNALDFPADKVLLLSGGVGITPVMAMARWFFDRHSPVDMAFIHSARTPRDIVYHDELRHMAARSDRFRLHLICEQDVAGEAWSGYRGYLGRTMLDLMAADFSEREIFCCGPTPYMAAVRQLLDAAGFDRARYHEEAFVAPAITTDTTTHALTHEVTFTRSGKAARVAPGQTVLAAAASLGLPLPKACGMGICGTCRVMKHAGEVLMTHNGGISDEEQAEGYILPCCSVPQGDVVIDF